MAVLFIYMFNKVQIKNKSSMPGTSPNKEFLSTQWQITPYSAVQYCPILNLIKICVFSDNLLQYWLCLEHYFDFSTHGHITLMLPYFKLDRYFIYVFEQVSKSCITVWIELRSGHFRKRADQPRWWSCQHTQGGCFILSNVLTI